MDKTHDKDEIQTYVIVTETEALLSFTEAEHKSPTVRQVREPKFLSQNYNFCHYTVKAFLLLFHFNHLNQVCPQTMLFWIKWQLVRKHH